MEILIESSLAIMKTHLNNKALDPISIFGLLFAFIGPYILPKSIVAIMVVPVIILLVWNNYSKIKKDNNRSLIKYFPLILGIMITLALAIVSWSQI